MKKWIAVALIFLTFISILFFFRKGIILDTIGIHFEIPFTKKINIPDTYSTVDRNQNGIADPLDIVYAARVEVENRTKYESNYYSGGFPPDDEGVCTDVIWRGLQGINIDLKSLMDADIASYTDLYPRVGGNPDPNIDFRRVPNQYVYFERNLETLTTVLNPYDMENLQQWQPGDIVVFLDGFHHVGIISERRSRNGIPYIIHNTPPFAAEISLSSITTPIAGHYRWKY